MWQIVLAFGAAAVAAYEIFEDYTKKKNILTPEQRAAADAAIKSNNPAQVVRTAQAIHAAGKPVAAAHLIHRANVALLPAPGSLTADAQAAVIEFPVTPPPPVVSASTAPVYSPGVLQTPPPMMHALTAAAPKSGDWGVTVRAPARPAGWVVDILPVQKALILVGALDAKSPTGAKNDDGVRGKGTDHALRFWQVNHGLNTSNGIADQVTADALGKAANGASLNASGSPPASPSISGESPLPLRGRRSYKLKA
jgi:hypothetical protein